MKQSKGSALLFVVLSLALFTIYMTRLASTASLSIDFASYRTDHIKKQYIVNGLCEYATTWVLDNFDSLLDMLETNKKIKRVIKWPPGSKDTAKGLLMLTHKKGDLFLTLKVIFLKKEVYRLSWYIRKKIVDAETVQFHSVQCTPNRQAHEQ